MGDEVPRCIPWGAAPGVTPVTPPWLSARRRPSWLEEISSSEVDPGLGPSPGEFLGLRWWFERGVDGLGGPGSGLLRGTLPSCAEGHNQEIGSPLFCLGLPESQAGASSPHASSGGGVPVCHTSFLESSQMRECFAEVTDAQWVHPASSLPPARMVPQDEALCQEVSSNLGRLDGEGE